VKVDRNDRDVIMRMRVDVIDCVKEDPCEWDGEVLMCFVSLVFNESDRQMERVKKE
jgi:hypothetical protein